MLKAKTPLLVGLLVVIGAGAFIFSFGSLDQGIDTDEAYPIFARFDDATGLVSGSRVMMSGIEVGRLGDIGLDPEQPDRARVQLFLRKDIQLKSGTFDADKELWVNGATAVRRQASLIGDYYVAVSPGIEGEPIQPGGMISNVVSDAGLSSVIKKLEASSAQIFPKLERITDDIKSITGGLRKTLGEENAVTDLKQIREDVAKTAENVALLTGEMRGFLKDSVYPRGTELRQIMDNVRDTTAIIERSTGRTSAALDRILGRLDQASADIGRFVADQTAPPSEAQQGTIAKAVASLDKNMALLEGSLENVRSITTNIDQGRGTVGRLLTDDKLINDIEKVVDDIEDLTATFSRTQIKMQFRTDYFIDRAAFKNTISISLHPQPDKYYLLQLVDDPIGRQRVKRRVTTTNDPLLPPVLVEDIVETSDELLVTVQMAKRWDFLTLRYGIMESSGGIGIDADLLNDTLNMKLDVFEFGRDEFPRMRFLAEWEFLTHIFLSAGVDDMLNAESRDFFVGVGVRFTDDDLKGVLPLAPSF